VKSDRRFPKEYGVLGDYMPRGFIRQQLFPFVFREPKAPLQEPAAEPPKPE
jgi:hypothetical protein